MGPPVEWRRRTGRPRQTWLRMVETDLRPMNLGLASAKRCAQNRAAWRQLVTTVTSTTRPWRSQSPCGKDKILREQDRLAPEIRQFEKIICGESKLRSTTFLLIEKVTRLHCHTAQCMYFSTHFSDSVLELLANKSRNREIHVHDFGI